MTSDANIQDWFERLGYAAEPSALHVRDVAIPHTHPYALEITELLKPDGAIRARAVFDVEGVPAVVFLDTRLSPSALDEVRKRIWNQNLVTVVIELKGADAIARPARKLTDSDVCLCLHESRPDGPFSATDVTTANLARRLPQWFDAQARVDQALLANLSVTVKKLTSDGFMDGLSQAFSRQLAELLMGQVLFISYLEHRDIVGATYRERRRVSSLHVLVEQKNRAGIEALVESLRDDFNGDFLGDDRHTPWANLANAGFDLLARFLQRTDMKTGQGDFWNYDFSYIPVELLSGLYEVFLRPEQQKKDGAYYTPRNLAMLVVDQAFTTSPDPLADTIFDGACGSGILLTTAYRRLIALSEARAGRRLGFAERGNLLTRCIFGADVNVMACRVTAFSLYLSLLEGLDPADILEAQERDGTKLPSLREKNLACGAVHGDFFKDTHAFYERRFSLIISNPPWAEPDGDVRTSTDDWGERAAVSFPRRQVAGAYTLRALDFLMKEGRVCLILPISQFLSASASNAAFVAETFNAYRPSRLINFGDLQGLLFPTSEHTCHVFLGERRLAVGTGRIPFGETFDYLVPKADISLLFGCLTMQSADRHALQTQTVVETPQLLVTMMWGDANDLAIYTRLAVRGTFSDFLARVGKQRRWTNRKGVHLQDKSRTPIGAGRLRKIPFIPVTLLRSGVPVLHPDLLEEWPVEQTTVVGLNDPLLKVFDGPRVIFPDGFSKNEQNVRAFYYAHPASFTASVGVIAGPEEDAGLLQFTAIYLRSTLARYFLMMSSWRMLCDRNGIRLIDLEAFPFFEPDNAPNPVVAHTVLQTVQSKMKALIGLSAFEQVAAYDEMRDELDQLMFSYFDLSEEEKKLVVETTNILLPSVRPRSFKSLDTPAQRRPRREDIAIYADTLGRALTMWRTRTHGHGCFNIDVVASNPHLAGPYGIVRISYDEHPTRPARISTKLNDDLALETLTTLKKAGLHAVASGNLMTLMPDVHLWVDELLYLARPLTMRNWTRRQALRDAERIVRGVQERQRHHQSGTQA